MRWKHFILVFNNSLYRIIGNIARKPIQFFSLILINYTAGKKKEILVSTIIKFLVTCLFSANKNKGISIINNNKNSYGIFKYN